MKSEYGDTRTIWEVYKRTRARVQHKSGERTDTNEEIQNIYRYTFTIRTSNQVNEKMVIEWNGNQYRILSIDSTIKQKLVIEAELVNE